MAKKLTGKQQIFIVKCLAAFMSPTEIVEAVKEEFDVEVSRQLVHRYHPEHAPVAKRWRILFDQERERFMDSVPPVGVAHQAYRLLQLQRLFQNAGRNAALKASLLEQAAKERGGQYLRGRVEMSPGDKHDLVADLAAAARELAEEFGPALGLTEEQIAEDVQRRARLRLVKAG